MTTFPRDIPSGARFKSGGLTLSHQTVRAPTRGGLTQVAELGTALWRAQYQTVLMREKDGMAFEAWLASLRGGVRTFRARDPVRRKAVTYPDGYASLTRHGGGSFADGTAVLSTIDTGRRSGAIGTLPSTFRLEPGDLFSVTSGSLQSLHRVITAATASNGVATIEWEPLVLPGVSSGAAVQLLDPWFKASLDASTVRAEWQPGRMCVVSFAGLQTYT